MKTTLSTTVFIRVCPWLMLAVVLVVGCTTTTKTTTHKTSTVISQEPVVATDQEIKGK